MACTNGSQKKSTSPDIAILTVGEIICGLYGESSLFCQYSKGGLGDIIPNAIFDVNAFCGSEPPAIPSISITDFFGTGWVEKAISAAKNSKWSEYCECKLPPPEPPPFSGGQCNCVKYIVNATIRFNDGSTRNIQNTLWGEVISVRCATAGGNGACQPTYLCRGFTFNSTVCNTLKEYSAASFAGGSQTGSPPTIAITSISRLDGTADTCGDPPGRQPPAPNPTIPPPPSYPDNLPPPPPPPQCKVCPSIPGAQGEKGDTGEKGEKGDKGDTGVKGDKGDKGDAGIQGIQGERGADGNRGVTGDKGEKGDKGDAGLPGVDGRDGLPGSDGNPGRDGLPGERGERGEPGLSIKGDKGDRGEQGIPGEDAKVEFDTVLVSYDDCTPGGELVSKSITFQVIKGDDGSTYDLYRELFQTLGGIDSQLCTIRGAMETLDLNIGVPMRGYEIPMPQCTVLYFNDTRTSKQGIGRYVNIPNPNNEEILKWAETDPLWQTGNWYVYTQYLTSRGAKVANYANDYETANQQQRILETFTNFTPGQIYHRGAPREVTQKLELQLRLKRVTYFPGILGQAGNEPGEVLFVNSNTGE